MGVFKRGASATDNSLVGFGRSLIVENNYGYTFQGMEAGGLTAPASPASTSATAAADRLDQPRAAALGRAKASLPSGLLYTYTRPGKRWQPALVLHGA